MEKLRVLWVLSCSTGFSIKFLRLNIYEIYAYLLRIALYICPYIIYIYLIYIYVYIHFVYSCAYCTFVYKMLLITWSIKNFKMQLHICWTGIFICMECINVHLRYILCDSFFEHSSFIFGHFMLIYIHTLQQTFMFYSCRYVVCCKISIYFP